jgi:thioredoxin reductase (NADPH)
MTQGKDQPWDVIVVGGGLAGLSAAIYLARAQRRTLVIDSGASLAQWEPEIQNYLGFPDGIAGPNLLDLGKEQARRYGANLTEDTISSGTTVDGSFHLVGESAEYWCHRLLLATGLFHLPPDVPGAKECLGHSMFFCKDCDAYRVRGKRIGIVGSNNEAVKYSLNMLMFSSCVVVATNGERPAWDARHAEWLSEYRVPIYLERITNFANKSGRLELLQLIDGRAVALDCVFTVRGDVYHNRLGHQLGARTDKQGQITTNEDQLTSIPGLYAAGCVTPANCQMIIAAGQGAIAAQAINRDLFEESLRSHKLRVLRDDQLDTEQTEPEVLD